MKKILILFTTLLLLIVLNVSAFASLGFNVEKMGTTNRVGNKLSQPVNLSFTSSGAWKLYVEPLDTQVRNLDTPSKSLPITRLEVAENSGFPLVHFDMGKSYLIKSGNTIGNNHMNLYINALNYTGDYPGNYLADFRFTLVQNDGTTQEEIFTFRFNQPEINSISFDKPSVCLDVAKNKSLKKNYQDHLKNPFSVYIDSNKDWKLYLIGRAHDDKNVVSYYYKVMGASDNTIDYPNCGEYMPMQNGRLLIAKGKSTLDNNTHQLMKKVINMDYMVKGPEGNILPAGVISTDFEYILETEEN